MYQDFNKLKETMQKFGYELNREYEPLLKYIELRKCGHKFSTQDHIKAMIYALLSNERGWGAIETKISEIDKLFHNFDVAYIKETEYSVFDRGIRSLKAGNRQITQQMQALKPNIEMLEKISVEFGSIDTYYNSVDKYDLVMSLARGKYKLRCMDIPLVSEYLKSVGVDIVKPDRHLKNIIARLGFSKNFPATDREVFDACEAIAKEYQVSNIEVDAVLWQYCAEDRFNKCGKTPNCNGCLVDFCKGRTIPQS